MTLPRYLVSCRNRVSFGDPEGHSQSRVYSGGVLQTLACKVSWQGWGPGDGRTGRTNTERLNDRGAVWYSEFPVGSRVSGTCVLISSRVVCPSAAIWALTPTRVYSHLPRHLTPCSPPPHRTPCVPPTVGGHTTVPIGPVSHLDKSRGPVSVVVQSYDRTVSRTSETGGPI